MRSMNPEMAAFMERGPEQDRELERRFESERVLGLMASIDERRMQLMTSEAAKQLETLRHGIVVPGSLEEVKSGVSHVERVLMQMPGEDKSVMAFRKHAAGEPVMRWTGDGRLESSRFDPVTGGVTWRERTASTPEGQRWLEFDRKEFSKRAKEDESVRAALATGYGVPIEAVDFGAVEMASRRVRPGHAVRAECAASALAAAIGFAEAAVSTASSDERGLMSVSGIVTGEQTSKENFDRAVAEPKSNARKSLVRAAMFANLVQETDEHGGSYLFDPATDSFRRIDFGCSLGYSYHDADGPKPADTPMSLSYEMMMEHDSWTLDDEARRLLSAVARECRANESTEGQDVTNEDLRNRVLLIRDAFRLVYERNDAAGRLVEGTDRVAVVEADDFVARMEHWAKTGRPVPLAEIIKC
jgi:hypothetical protein